MNWFNFWVFIGATTAIVLYFQALEFVDSMPGGLARSVLMFLLIVGPIGLIAGLWDSIWR